MLNDSNGHLPEPMISRTFRSIGSFFQSVANYCGPRNGDVSEALPLETEIVDVLSLRAVISWVSDNTPKNQVASKAALLQEEHGSLMKFTTVFLDAKHRPVLSAEGVPCGRAQKVRKLDAELSEYFGNRSMVLLE